MFSQDAPKYLLEDGGKCSYTVVDASPHVSKANNQMIKLKLEAEDKQGRLSTVYDYLMNKKLEKFLEIHELPKHLNSHSDLSILYGLKGHFKNKYWEPEVGKKFNQVDYYLKPSGKKKEEPESEAFFDENIPF